MSENILPRHSLKEEAKQILRQRFEDAPGPRSRVLWWDEGGHLLMLLAHVCQELDVEFGTAKHPLKFRQWIAKHSATPEEEPDSVLWHMPEAMHGRDWFRDVEVMGGVIEKSIEDLAANVYGVQRWQIRPWESDAPLDASVAAKLDDELRESGGMPTLSRLQGRILTGGASRPVEHVLRNGWGELSRSDDVVDKIQHFLSEERVPHLEQSDGPDTIVRKVRRWTVAGWLYEAGVSAHAFPNSIASSDLAYAYRRLASVLKTDPQSEVLPTYQETYWPDVVDALEDPWKLLRCPVDGAVEIRLWTAWLSDFDDENYETCRDRASTRVEALRAYTGRTDQDVSETSPPWIRAWQQAAALADLARRYETWDERKAPAHVLYADREEGSWQIDAAVRRIIVSGTPEQELPSGHPARESLAYHRERLVETEYLDYLRDLSDEMETALAQGDLVDDNLSSAVHFWSDHEKELGAGNEALFFYLDALRLDLARELADQLQARSDASDELDLNVEESTRLGVVPSETEFGMAAVLPGRPKSYEVRLDNGALNAYRNGSPLNADKRRKLLEEEGWAVASDDPSGWSQTRVAYYSKEIDDYGEASMQDIERRLAERVRTLADEIFNRVRKGDWNRAYVVTDHGFVLLPEDAQFEDLTPPGGDVKRRRVAAEDLSDDGPGVLLTGDQTPELFSYLSSPVRLLLDPQHRFKKQGIPDSRYYHGGALPQECILSFLKIEAA